MNNTTDALTDLTLFTCGPSKCEHDYSGWQEWTDPDGCRIGSALCVKCGAAAIDEAAWL